jgi:hypothetical protein
MYSCQRYLDILELLPKTRYTWLSLWKDQRKIVHVNTPSGILRSSSCLTTWYHGRPCGCAIVRYRLVDRIPAILPLLLNYVVLPVDNIMIHLRALAVTVVLLGLNLSYGALLPVHRYVLTCRPCSYWSSHSRATVCNGHADLCSRSYSNITFVGAHDSFAFSRDPFARKCQRSILYYIEDNLQQLGEIRKLMCLLSSTLVFAFFRPKLICKFMAPARILATDCHGVW